MSTGAKVAAAILLFFVLYFAVNISQSYSRLATTTTVQP